MYTDNKQCNGETNWRSRDKQDLRKTKTAGIRELLEGDSMVYETNGSEVLRAMKNLNEGKRSEVGCIIHFL